jgi:putative transposase
MNFGRMSNRLSRQHHLPACGGRPCLEDRRAFEAIVYVLRTGIQWNALPRELGASTTVYDRFRRMAKSKGYLNTTGHAGLQEYDASGGHRLGMAKPGWSDDESPGSRGAATSANPTDRGKRGTKRSQLSDGRGIPLALIVAGANRHDMRLVEATLDIIMTEPYSHAGAAPAFVPGCRL